MTLDEMSEGLRRIEAGEPFGSVFGVTLPPGGSLDMNDLPPCTPRGIPDLQPRTEEDASSDREAAGLDRMGVCRDAVGGDLLVRGDDAEQGQGKGAGMSKDALIEKLERRAVLAESEARQYKDDFQAGLAVGLREGIYEIRQCQAERPLAAVDGMINASTGFYNPTSPECRKAYEAWVGTPEAQRKSQDMGLYAIWEAAWDARAEITAMGDVERRHGHGPEGRDTHPSPANFTTVADAASRKDVVNVPLRIGHDDLDPDQTLAYLKPHGGGFFKRISDFMGKGSATIAPVSAGTVQPITHAKTLQQPVDLSAGATAIWDLDDLTKMKALSAAEACAKAWGLKWK